MRNVIDRGSVFPLFSTWACSALLCVIMFLSHEIFAQNSSDCSLNSSEGINRIFDGYIGDSLSFQTDSDSIHFLFEEPDTLKIARLIDALREFNDFEEYTIRVMAGESVYYQDALNKSGEEDSYYVDILKRLKNCDRNMYHFEVNRISASKRSAGILNCGAVGVKKKPH
jgi:hypothetical protein